MTICTSELKDIITCQGCSSGTFFISPPKCYQITMSMDTDQFPTPWSWPLSWWAWSCAMTQEARRGMCRWRGSSLWGRRRRRRTWVVATGRGTWRRGHARPVLQWLPPREWNERWRKGREATWERREEREGWLTWEKVADEDGGGQCWKGRIAVVNSVGAVASTPTRVCGGVPQLLFRGSIPGRDWWFSLGLGLVCKHMWAKRTTVWSRAGIRFTTGWYPWIRQWSRSFQAQSNMALVGGK